MTRPGAHRLRRAGAHARDTARRSLSGFLDDDATQSAAAISYYALFSLFPVAILLVVGFGVIVDEEAARRQVIDFVLENVPLSEDQGRRRLEEVLTSVTTDTGGFGVAGAIGLVVAASGVMGAVRKALNRAWDVTDPRPLAQAKAVDVLLVVGLGLLMALSFTLTFLTRLTVSLSQDVEEALGPVASVVPRIVLALGQLVPALVAFAAFLLLFRVVPAAATRLRDVWPGALLAALGFEAAKTGFSIYLENFANYNAVYASLAAVVAFLVFVFFTANVFLLAAEVAVEWPKVRDGDVGDDDEDVAFTDRVRQAIARLFVRGERR